MGRGTFNLVEFFRQLGIKTPEPDVREFLQPVVIASDLSKLSPQHVPPTYLGGVAIGQVVGEYGIVQITSTAPGGTILRGLYSTPEFKWGIAARTAGLAAVGDVGPMSMKAAQVVVESGTDAVNPHAANTCLAKFANWWTGLELWIPPGKTLVFATPDANAVLNLSLLLQDVPSFEVSPD